MKRIYIILLSIIIVITSITLYAVLINNKQQEQYNSVESWTVTWKVKDGEYYSDNLIKQKTFLREDEAKAFKRKIESYSSFLGCWIKISISKNN